VTATLPFALAVLVPVMVGPLPAEAGRTLTMHLCNGGTITIPLDDGTPAQGGGCHPKGCHAGTCREKEQEKHPSREN
jgi:hypothetical protein